MLSTSNKFASPYISKLANFLDRFSRSMPSFCRSIYYQNPYPSLHNFSSDEDDIYKSLKEYKRVLKKNGKIFIATDSASYLRSIMISIYKTKFLFNWYNDRPQIWTYETLDLPFTKFFKKAKNSYRIPFFIELIKI